MIKRRATYFILFLLFAAFVWFESIKPRQIDWSYNFSYQSKMPYGCFVLYKFLPSIFKYSETTINYDNPYSWEKACKGCNNRATLIISNNFSPDSNEFKALKRNVFAGSDILISAQFFDQLICDSLGLTIKNPILKGLRSQQIKLNFTNPLLRSDKNYKFNINEFSYFEKFNANRTILLSTDSEKRAVFLKIPYGKGSFYLCSMPVLFSNYYLLHNNPEYTFKCLSYLKSINIVWDEYYNQQGLGILKSQSPIRFILSKPALRTAYYLLVFTALLFIFLEGRRKQRIIPEYKRPDNSSLDFVKTIAMLFFNQRKNKHMAEKRIIYFHDYIYSHFFIRFDESDNSFTKQLVEKSMVNEALVNKIINTILWIKKQKEISDAELFEFIDVTNRFMYYVQINNL